MYHSGLCIDGEHTCLIFDYLTYAPKADAQSSLIRERLNADKPMYVFVSHSHGDHFDPAILKWRENKNIQYIFSYELSPDADTVPASAVYMKPGDVWHDKHLTVKAFGSTDIGISFLISFEGKLLFHAGDLNNWHWCEESSPYEIAQMEEMFFTELNKLAAETAKLDVVMFPVDPRLGTDYIRGARQFIEKIQTSVFVPMHFKDNLEAAAAFEETAAAHGVKNISWKYIGQSISI